MNKANTRIFRPPHTTVPTLHAADQEIFFDPDHPFVVILPVMKCQGLSTEEYKLPLKNAIKKIRRGGDYSERQSIQKIVSKNDN